MPILEKALLSTSILEKLAHLSVMLITPSASKQYVYLCMYLHVCVIFVVCLCAILLCVYEHVSCCDAYLILCEWIFSTRVIHELYITVQSKLVLL